jgi:hypothetical protein
METYAGEKVANRYHPRVFSGLKVKLKTQRGVLMTQSIDLSMAGVCVEGEVAAMAERLTIAVQLPNDRLIVTGARVRSFKDGNTGIEFDQLDWEDLFALARFLHPRLP